MKRKTRIYIASSWKLVKILLGLVKRLREEGFDVDCFCEPREDRYVFGVHDMKADVYFLVCSPSPI